MCSNFCFHSQLTAFSMHFVAIFSREWNILCLCRRYVFVLEMVKSQNRTQYLPVSSSGDGNGGLCPGSPFAAALLLRSQLEVASVMVEAFPCGGSYKGHALWELLVWPYWLQALRYLRSSICVKVGMYTFISKSPFYRTDYTAFEWNYLVRMWRQMWMH